ncbi:MAG: nucleotide exchange factor GrpE, partial [Oscillospiraceae bacterium]|nr:nucleotide exchange factor GrpE [Oscillospiraceae bacterium]
QNKGGDEKTNQAIAMMKQQFEHIAESSGVELLRDETEREKPFDPTRHNAINPVAPGGEISVAMVVQCGCAVGGKVIRPADVAVVATAISET